MPDPSEVEPLALALARPVCDMILKNIHRKICLVFYGIIARSALENKFSEDERAKPLEAKRVFLRSHISDGTPCPLGLRDGFLNELSTEKCKQR